MTNPLSSADAGGKTANHQQEIGQIENWKDGRFVKIFPNGVSSDGGNQGVDHAGEGTGGHDGEEGEFEALKREEGEGG